MSSRTDDRRFIDIIEERQDIARDWLKGLSPEEFGSYDLSGPVGVALAQMDDTEKCAIIQGIGEDAIWEDTLAILARSLDAYQALLLNKAAKRHHLVPLHESPSDWWAQKGILALNAGYTPEEVADASLLGVGSRTGSYAEMWGNRVQTFERLKAHPDKRLVRVAERGSAEASARYEAAAEEEKHRAIFPESL